MEGGGAVRLCRVCDQKVHDLSAMPEAEARRLLAADPKPCIRYSHDAQGRVLFADRSATTRSRLAAAALTLASLASGCLMGKMDRPRPPADPQTEAARAERPPGPADAESPPTARRPGPADAESPPTARRPGPADAESPPE